MSASVCNWLPGALPSNSLIDSLKVFFNILEPLVRHIWLHLASIEGDRFQVEVLLELCELGIKGLFFVRINVDGSHFAAVRLHKLLLAGSRVVRSSIIL